MTALFRSRAFGRFSIIPCIRHMAIPTMVEYFVLPSTSLSYPVWELSDVHILMLHTASEDRKQFKAYIGTVNIPIFSEQTPGNLTCN